MGNILGYPPHIEAKRREKLAARQKQTSTANSLQRARPVVLPYNSGFSMDTRSQNENTSQVEVETIKLSSNNTSRASSFKRANRYIKRYRNEEEKLLDMLQEREAIIKSAIRQGQELRAKCDRYKEELDSVKALSDVDMTDLEWKKMYNELDKRNRDLKEELDILSARNKNGRDHLRQQDEIIQQLNAELQQERIEKQRLISNSLNSLQSVGVKDKKGKLMITQLEVDNKLLQERLNDLTVRNQRGREYLSKLEAEKREQDSMVAKLKTQLLREKADKEKLQTRLEILSSTHNLSAIGTAQDQPVDIYAQVQTSKGGSTGKQTTNSLQSTSLTEKYEKVINHHENIDTKSTGFEIDRPNTNIKNSSVDESKMYEEVGFENTGGDVEPYITTYAMNSNTSTGTGSSMTSTPRNVEDIITHDTEPVWDYVPESKEMDVHNVTTRF